jgi:hypothetical protein
MNDVGPSESGLASGVVNTAFMMGGSLGLAVLASLAAARTQAVETVNGTNMLALTSGYQLAFLVGACFAVLGALAGAVFLRTASAVGSEQAAAMH